MRQIPKKDGNFFIKSISFTKTMSLLWTFCGWWAGAAGREHASICSDVLYYWPRQLLSWSPSDHKIFVKWYETWLAKISHPMWHLLSIFHDELVTAVRAAARLVCSTSLMASLIRSVGGLSKYFYKGLWLADLNADVVGQSIIDVGLPRNSLVTWLFLLPFLHDFCMDFQTDSRGHGRSYVACNIR